jgi:tetratricopeptide (TPR) repeat protein
MADDAELSGSGAASSSASSEAATWAVLGAAGREKADAFLDQQMFLAARQARLADLQIEQLRHEMPLQLSHLRWRRFGDFTKSIFEVALGALIVLVVLVFCIMAWRAANDRSLVVDAFSVPPDWQQSGYSGEALASRFLDRLKRIQRHSQSARASRSYRSSNDAKIALDIPQTGISLSEVQHLMSAWLGHETHIAGQVVRTTKGVALVVTLGDEPAVTTMGNEGEVEDLIERAAEGAYAVAEPYRFANFLRRAGRTQEALVALQNLAVTGNGEDRKWALQSWAAILGFQGQSRQALNLLHEVVSEHPTFHTAWNDLAYFNFWLGRYEAALDAFNTDQQILTHYPQADTDHDRLEFDRFFGRAASDEISGAFADSVRERSLAFETDRKLYTADSLIPDRLLFASALIESHDPKAGRQIMAQVDGSGAFIATFDSVTKKRIAEALAIAQLKLEAEDGDWASASGTGERLLAIARGEPAFRLWYYASLAAVANARNGKVALARRLIAQTPGDCYPCLLARAKIDEAAQNSSGAEFWFAQAAGQGPSVPLAYADWGEMLLAKGNLNGAIAKYTLANQKGPHFADPLEMWGEALMAKNRSDLALAKFEEANKYAPNWGRLHLKWGEALAYADKKDEARKQFAIAAQLDLSAADRNRLRQMEKGR